MDDNTQTLMNSEGWIVTTVKTFKVEKTKLKFSGILDWIRFNKENPKVGKQLIRQHCNRCLVKWEDMENKEGWVNLAVVSHVGNRVVCCKCAAEIVAEKF